MPRPYTIEFENVAVTTANGDQDIFSIDPGTDLPVALTGVVVKTISELAEAQEEWLRIRVIRGHATVGSGGAAATARPDSAADAAFGGTARTNDTTIASTGTAVNLWSDAFNVRVGYEMFWTPEQYKWSSGASLIVVRLMAAVTDDVTMSGTLGLIEFP